MGRVSTWLLSVTGRCMAREPYAPLFLRTARCYGAFQSEARRKLGDMEISTPGVSIKQYAVTALLRHCRAQYTDGTSDYMTGTTTGQGWSEIVMQIGHSPYGTECVWLRHSIAGSWRGCLYRQYRTLYARVSLPTITTARRCVRILPGRE